MQEKIMNRRSDIGHFSRPGQVLDRHVGTEVKDDADQGGQET